MIDLSLGQLATMTREEAERAIRRRVQTAYLGNGLVLARVLGHLKLFLSTKDRGFACHVMLDGYWEIWLTLFFARLLKPGMTVFDVGANFGYYTVLFADAVGARGNVTAIEPVPDTAALLQESIDLNGFAAWTRVVQAAAGAQAGGEAHMIVPSGEPKNAAVVGLPQPGSLSVPVTSLDVLAMGLSRIDVVKIDAEGSEVGIIKGMSEVIARHRPALLLEFNAARYPERAARLISDLLTAYPVMHALDFNGALAAVSPSVVLTTRVGEDWLLFFSPTGDAVPHGDSIR